MATNQGEPPVSTAAQGATSAEDGDVAVGSVDNACNTGTGSDTKHDNTSEGPISSTEDDLGRGEVDKQDTGCHSDKGKDKTKARKVDGNEEDGVPSKDKPELGAKEEDATKDTYKKDVETRAVADAMAGSRPDKEIDESKMAVDGLAKQGHTKDQSTENIHSNSGENFTETEKKIDVNDGKVTLNHNNVNKPEMKTAAQVEIREGRTTDVETGKAEEIPKPDSVTKNKENNGNLKDNLISVDIPSSFPDKQEKADLNAEKRGKSDTEITQRVTHGDMDKEVGMKDDIENPVIDGNKDANKKNPPEGALKNKSTSKSKALNYQDPVTGKFEDEEQRWSEETKDSVSTQDHKKLDTANPEASTSDQVKMENGRRSSNSTAESKIEFKTRTLEDTVAGNKLNEENEDSKDSDVVTNQDHTRDHSTEKDFSNSNEEFGREFNEKTGKMNDKNDGEMTLDHNNGNKPEVIAAIQSDKREDRTTDGGAERTETTPSLKPSDSVISGKENFENLQDNLNVIEESFASSEIEEKVDNKDLISASANGKEKAEGGEKQVKKKASDYGDGDHELDIRNDSNEIAPDFGGNKTAAKDKDPTGENLPEDSHKNRVDGKLENADIVTGKLQDEEQKLSRETDKDTRQSSKELESTYLQLSTVEQKENGKRVRKSTAENISSASKHLAEKETSSSNENSQNFVGVGKFAGVPETLDEDIEYAGDREPLPRKPSPESGSSGETLEKPSDKIVEVQSDTPCTTEKKIPSKIQEQELEGKNVCHESIGSKGKTADADSSESLKIPVIDQRNNTNSLDSQVQTSFYTTEHEDETHVAEKVTTESQNGEEINTKVRGKEGTCRGIEETLSSENVAEDERYKKIENLDVANSPNIPEVPNRETTEMEIPTLQATPHGDQNLIFSNESNKDGRKSISEEGVDESRKEENMHIGLPQKQMFVTAASSMPTSCGHQKIPRGYDESTNSSENIKWDSEKDAIQSIAKYSMIRTESNGENEDQESSDEERQNQNKRIREVHPDTKDEKSKYVMDQQLRSEEDESEILRNFSSSDILFQCQSSGRVHEYEDQIELLLNEIVLDETVDKNREEWKKKSKLKLLSFFNKVIKEVTEGTSGLSSVCQEDSHISIDNSTSSSDQSGGSTMSASGSSQQMNANVQHQHNQASGFDEAGRGKNVGTAITTQPKPTPGVPGSPESQNISKNPTNLNVHWSSKESSWDFEIPLYYEEVEKYVFRIFCSRTEFFTLLFMFENKDTKKDLQRTFSSKGYTFPLVNGEINIGLGSKTEPATIRNEIEGVINSVKYNHNIQVLRAKTAISYKYLVKKCKEISPDYQRDNISIYSVKGDIWIIGRNGEALKKLARNLKEQGCIDKEQNEQLTQTTDIVLSALSEKREKKFGPIKIGSSEILKEVYFECSTSDFYKLLFLFENIHFFQQFCGKVKEMRLNVFREPDTQCITIVVPSLTGTGDMFNLGLKGVEGIFKGMFGSLIAKSTKIRNSSAETVVNGSRRKFKECLNGEVLIYCEENDDTVLWFVTEKKKEALIDQIYDQMYHDGLIEEGAPSVRSEKLVMDFIPMNTLDMAIIEEFNVVDNFKRCLQAKVQEIYVDDVKSEVVLTTPNSDFSFVKKALYSFVNEIKETKSRMENVLKSCIPFLEMPLVREKVKPQFQFLIDVDKENSEAYIYTKHKEDAINLAKDIERLFCEKVIPVEGLDTDSQILKKKISEWKEDSSNMVEIEVSKSSIFLYGLQECLDVIIPQLKSYILQNTKEQRKSSMKSKSPESHTLSELDRHSDGSQNEQGDEEGFAGEIIIDKEKQLKVLAGQVFQNAVEEIKEKHQCSVKVEVENIYPDKLKTSNGFLWKFEDGKQVFFNRTKTSDFLENNTDCIVDFLPVNEKLGTDENSFFKRDGYPIHVWWVIVHLPVWQDGKAQEKNQLRKQILYLFQKLRAAKLTSVTIPLLTQVTLKWPSSQLLKQILFLRRYFTNTVVFCHPEEEQYTKLLSAFENLRDVADSSVVNIRVEKKRFTDAKVQVLVNTTGKELKLNHGYVSNSILTAAGNEMQMEAKRKCPKGLQSGEVLVTDAYKLHERGIEKVFHGSLPFWNPDASIAALKSLVAKCLHLATEFGMTSIAFPALGTGNLGYDHFAVANAMFETVRSFVETSTLTSLTEVVFVVFDENSAKAFFLEEKKYSNVPCISGRLMPKTYQFPTNGAYFEVNCGEVWLHDLNGIILLYDKAEVFQGAGKECIRQCGRLAQDLWRGSSGKQKLQSEILSIMKHKLDSSPVEWIFHMTLHPGREAGIVAAALKCAEDYNLGSVAFVISNKDAAAQYLSEIVKSVFTASKEIKKGSSLKRIILDVDMKLFGGVCKELEDPAFENFTTQKKKQRCHIKFESKTQSGLHEAKKEVMSALDGTKSSAAEKPVASGEGGAEIPDNQADHNRQPKEAEKVLPEINTDQERPVELQSHQRLLVKKVLTFGKGHYTARDQGKDVTLSRLENEKCCLILSIRNEDLQKEEIDCIKRKLKKDVFDLRVPVTAIIFPFLSDKEALIKFSSKDELEEFRNCVKSEDYELRDFPAQAVTCVNATVSKTALVQFRKKGWDPEDIVENSGVAITNQNGSLVLEGSLLEMQVAREFIRNACQQHKTYKSGKEYSRNGEGSEEMKKYLLKADVQVENDFSSKKKTNSELETQEKKSSDSSSSSLQKDTTPGSIKVDSKVQVKQDSSNKEQIQSEIKTQKEKIGDPVSSSLTKDATLSIKNVPKIPCSAGSTQLKEPVDQTMRSKVRVCMSVLEYKILQRLELIPRDIQKVVNVNEKVNYMEIVGNSDKVEHYERALEKIRSMNDEKLNIDQKMINVFNSHKEDIQIMFPDVSFLMHDNMLHLISSEDLTHCKSNVEEMLTSPQEGMHTRKQYGRTYRKKKDKDVSHHSNSNLETQNPASGGNIPIPTSVYTKRGISVYVLNGDVLSMERIDCFVNPTNENLKLDAKGGLSAAVLKKAGNDVQKECNELLKTKSKLQPAECARTGPGYLKYKSIIHTIVKPWKDFINRNTQVQDVLNHIQNVVSNCLIMANGHEMKSIAIPAIGSGQSGIPHMLCATGFRMGCELFMQSASSHLKHIFFILNNDKFMSLVEMTFKTPLPWYSFWPKSDQYTFHISKECSVIIAQRDVLLERYVDGLVVLEDPFMLGEGKLIKTVIELGKKIFFNNRQKLKTKNNPPGSAVKCKCVGVYEYKTVYHIIMPDWKKEPWTEKDVSVYKCCISKALSLSKEEKSIAMKLFVGGSSKDVAMYFAKALVEAVTEYIKSNKSSSLQQIFILNMETFRHGLVKSELIRFTKEACNSNSYLENAVFVNAYLDPQTDKKYVPGTLV